MSYFDQYSEMAATYFTPGSKFVFSAGVHDLQTMLGIENISDLTLKGNSLSSASIFIEVKLTIKFKNAIFILTDSRSYSKIIISCI